MMRGATLPFLLLGGIALAILLARPADPLPGDAPAAEFSATRAMQHVNFLAAQPRPIGSIAHDVARDYLVEELRRLGLDTQVQDATVSYLRASRPGTSRFARVRNVIARLPGSGGGQSLLLMAHYDSRPLTPGAGDDASGTATLLETARALAGTSGFRNDIIFLFTDGEESGLFGAQAFFRDHPLASEVGTVLNFEARGSRGPVLMFQSSPGSAGLIRTLSGHAKQPSGTSLADAIYRRMPNDTDFSISLEHGKAGMNFAYLDGFFDYHSPTDTPENLSMRTLQQLGDNALPLARHLADAELPLASDSDRAYFNVFGTHGFVSYPAVVDILVLVAGILLAGFFSVRAWRRGAISVAGSLRGLATSVFLLVFPALAVAAAFGLFVETRSEDAIRALLAQSQGWFIAWLLIATGTFAWLAARLRQAISNIEASAVAIVMLLGLHSLGISLIAASIIAILLGGGAVLLLGDRVRTSEQQAGNLLLWILLGIAALLLEPAAAYLFNWPLVLVATTLLVATLSNRPLSPVYRGLVLLPVLTTYGLLIYMFYLALGYAQPVLVALPLLLLAIVAKTLFPPREAAESRWGLAVLILGLAIAPMLATVNPFNERHPRPTQLFVIEDAVEGHRFIGAGDATLSTWQQSILGMATHREMPTHWIIRDRDAYLQQLAGTATGVMGMTLLEDAANDTERQLRVRMQGEPGAARGYLRIRDANSVRRLHVDGEPVTRPPLDAGEDWTIYWVGMPDEGFELLFTVESDQVLQLDATSFRDGLPPSLELPPRPGDEMPEPYSWSDSQVFIERFEF